jgi:uncharacterized protein (TIGR02466 family)
MLTDLFAIPKWNFNIPNFEQNKSTILNGVEKIRQKDSGITLSNFGGYHSAITFETSDSPEFNSIFSFLREKCIPQVFNDLNFYGKQHVKINSWINVNKEASYNILHNHIGGEYIGEFVEKVVLFSGVCFIQCPEGSGKLLFKNGLLNNLWFGLLKTNQKSKYISDTIEIDPIEGEIHIWPSYLHHMVHMNKHDKERISIAFNILVKV